MKNQVECPKCLGAKEIMVARTTGKGFTYITCNLCNGKGSVPEEIAEDFIFSESGEENFEIDDNY